MKCSALCSNCCARFASSPFAALIGPSISAICCGLRFGFCLLLLDASIFFFDFVDGTLDALERRLGRDRLAAGRLDRLIERGPRVRDLAGLEERDAVVIAEQRYPLRPLRGRRSAAPRTSRGPASACRLRPATGSARGGAWRGDHAQAARPATSGAGRWRTGGGR